MPCTSSQRKAGDVSENEAVQVPEELKSNVFLSGVEFLYNWSRRYSMWAITFGLACCAIEMIAAVASSSSQYGDFPGTACRIEAVSGMVSPTSALFWAVLRETTLQTGSY